MLFDEFFLDWDFVLLVVGLVIKAVANYNLHNQLLFGFWLTEL